MRKIILWASKCRTLTSKILWSVLLWQINVLFVVITCMKDETGPANLSGCWLVAAVRTTDSYTFPRGQGEGSGTGFAFCLENFRKTPALECCCDPGMTHMNEQLSAEMFWSSSMKHADSPLGNTISMHLKCVRVCVFLLCHVDASLSFLVFLLHSEELRYPLTDVEAASENFALLCVALFVFGG